MSVEKCPKCLSLVPPGADECVRCGYYLGGGADTGFFPEQTIDKTYRLVRRIGEGGMGEVWLATDTAIGQPVAVKLLHPDLMRDRRARELAAAEPKRLGRLLNAAHVVQIKRAIDTPEVVALVMEYADSGNRGAYRPSRSTTLGRERALLDSDAQRSLSVS